MGKLNRDKLESIATRVESLGEDVGLLMRLADANGRSYGSPLPAEIPELIIALAKSTRSRSSTTMGKDMVYALPVFIEGETLIVIIYGEVREDHSFRLIKHVLERSMV